MPRGSIRSGTRTLGSPGHSRYAIDPATLAACLKFDLDFDRCVERLGTYAFLKTAEDTTDGKYQRMQGRYINAASRAAQATSYIRPEILPSPPPD